MSATQQSARYITTGYMSAGTIAPGYVACLDAAGAGFIVSTLANRTASGRPSACISLSSSDIRNVAFDAQFVGMVPANITGLGAGIATNVSVSDTGVLQRTSATDSTVIGTCDADGTAYVSFPQRGGGGGGTSVTFAGDLSGTSTSQTVQAIQGVNISGSSALNKQLVGIDATHASWQTVAAGVTIGGDLSVISSTSQSVDKVKQTAIGTSGGGSVGAPLRMTGTSTADWGRLDLSNGNAVTGILPSANQAAQTMVGDVTGFTSASVVSAINGVIVSGSSALNKQLVGIDATHASWQTVAAGAASQGSAGQANYADGSGGWTSWTGITGAANRMMFATTGQAHAPSATVGQIAFQDESSAQYITYVVSNGVAYNALSRSGDTLRVGDNTNAQNLDLFGARMRMLGPSCTIQVDTSAIVKIAHGNSGRIAIQDGAGSEGCSIQALHNGANVINTVAGAYLSLQSNSSEALRIDGTNLYVGAPLGGLAAPLVLRQTPLAFSGADITLSAAQQACPILVCSGSGGNIIVPSGYYIVDNSASGSSRLIKTASSAGATVASSQITTVYYNGTDFKIVAVH